MRQDLRDSIKSAPTPRQTRGRSAVSPPVIENNKRTSAQAGITLTPDTKTAAKQLPIKKIKDQPVKPPKIQKLILKDVCEVDSLVPDQQKHTVLQEGSKIYNFILLKKQSESDEKIKQLFVGQLLIKMRSKRKYVAFFRWNDEIDAQWLSYYPFASKDEALERFEWLKEMKISDGYTEILKQY